jgi:hypothetical protein
MVEENQRGNFGEDQLQRLTLMIALPAAFVRRCAGLMQ